MPNNPPRQATNDADKIRTADGVGMRTGQLSQLKTKILIELWAIIKPLLSVVRSCCDAQRLTQLYTSVNELP